MHKSNIIPVVGALFILIVSCVCTTPPCKPGTPARAGEGPICRSDDVDSDGDGLGDAFEANTTRTDPCCNDTDGDLLLDGEEWLTIHSDPLDNDTDDDGLLDGIEVLIHGTNPSVADTDADGLSDRDELHVFSTLPTCNDTDGDGVLDGDECIEYRSDPCSVDSDSDGLPDGLEAHVHHTNLTNADTDGDGLGDHAEVVTYRTDPLRADTDLDGLSDPSELFSYMTNASLADTDRDGATDGLEVMSLGTDPLVNDTDGDGLLDGLEHNTVHSDPIDPDSDDDGLADGAEVNGYHTSPLLVDTDGDTLTDPDELFVYLTDPTKLDSDGDSIHDQDELFVYRTSPILQDSDGDGLTDPRELFQLHSDPLDTDTDGDGLGDGLEVTMWYTDILNPDSDGDGLTDGLEVSLDPVAWPTSADSDMDGMGDAWEYRMGTRIRMNDANEDPDGDGLPNILEMRAGTHPFNKDTDGDIVDDGTEVREGSSPLDYWSRSPLAWALLALTFAVFGGIGLSSILCISVHLKARRAVARGRVYVRKYLRWKMEKWKFRKVKVSFPYADRRLNLSGIRAKRFSDIFGIKEALKHVDELILRGKAIRSIPESADLSRLKKLDITNSRFEDLGFIRRATSLRELNATHSRIKGELDLSCLPALVKVNVKDNKLTSIVGTAGLARLEELHVSRNEIARLPDLPRSIKKVTARKNKITTFDGLSDAWHLHTLDVSMNRLVLDADDATRAALQGLRSCDELKDLVLLKEHDGKPDTNHVSMGFMAIVGNCYNDGRAAFPIAYVKWARDASYRYTDDGLQYNPDKLAYPVKAIKRPRQQAPAPASRPDPRERQAMQAATRNPHPQPAPRNDPQKMPARPRNMPQGEYLADVGAENGAGALVQVITRAAHAGRGGGGGNHRKRGHRAGAETPGLRKKKQRARFGAIGAFLREWRTKGLDLFTKSELQAWLERQGGELSNRELDELDENLTIFESRAAISRIKGRPGTYLIDLGNAYFQHR